MVEKNIKEWESKKEEVIVLINQAKSEFTAHINSIKNGGKQLSQLPKIQVPKPPPCPKLFPMPPKSIQVSQMSRISPIPNQSAVVAALQQQQQASSSSHINNSNATPSSPLPLERKAITPPSNRSRLGAASNGSATPQHSSINAMISPIPPTNSFANTISNSANATPVKGVHDLPDTLNMLRDFHHSRALQLQMQRQSQQTQSPMSDAQVGLGGSTIAPIGVRPQNYQNGMAQQQQKTMHQQPQQQFFAHQHAQQSPSGFSASNNLIPTQSHINHQQQQISQQHMPYMSQSQQHQNKTSMLSTNSITSSNCLNSSNNSGNIFQSWGGWGTDQLNNISELFGQGRSFGPLGSDFGGNSAARAANDNTKTNFINSTANNNNVSNESNVFFP